MRHTCNIGGSGIRLNSRHQSRVPPGRKITHFGIDTATPSVYAAPPQDNGRRAWLRTNLQSSGTGNHFAAGVAIVTSK